MAPPSARLINASNTPQPQCHHAQPQASLPTASGCITQLWRTFWDLVSQTCTTASSVPVPKIWPSGCNATLLYAESIVGLVNCRNSRVSALRIATMCFQVCLTFATVRVSASPYRYNVSQTGLDSCKIVRVSALPYCHSVSQGGLINCKTAGCLRCHICCNYLSGLHTNGASVWTDSMPSAVSGRQHESPLSQQTSRLLDEHSQHPILGHWVGGGEGGQ